MLFKDYPREFGKKRIFVEDKETFVKLIHKYNGLLDCFTTVYSVPKHHDYPNARIDKLFFDIDPESNSQPWETTKLLHKQLEGIKHAVVFSGGGFHIYVFIKEQKFKQPKETIRSAQLKILNGLKTDSHIIGDIARITRIPNTWNLKRQRFCIPLCEQDFGLFYEEIQQKAKRPQFVGGVFEGKVLNINKFDQEKPVQINNGSSDDIVQEIKDTQLNSYVQLLPPVAQRLLVMGKDNPYDRYLQILAFKERGFPMQLAIMIAKRFWRPQILFHSVIEERQFEYVYGRADLHFPNWATLEQKGYIVSEKDKLVAFYR